LREHVVSEDGVAASTSLVLRRSIKATGDSLTGDLVLSRIDQEQVKSSRVKLGI
jgi:hypothetical protein